MSKKIRIIVCITIFLFFNAFFSHSSYGNPCKWVISSFLEAIAYPLSSSSSDNPSIGVKVYRCAWGKETLDKLKLTSGEVQTVRKGLDSAVDYRYHAEIRIDKKTCKNKCVYANGCPFSSRKNPPLNQCHGNSGFCNPQLTSFTIKMCQRSAHNASVGICAYRSNKTVLQQIFSDLWNDISAYFEAVGKSAACQNPMISPQCSMAELVKDINAITPKSRTKSKLLDCYPVHTQPLPYPFCKISIKNYSPLTILRMCEIGETPYRTLSGSTKECVYPAPATSNMQSTFMKPCVRVTYNNAKSDSSVVGNNAHNNIYNIDYTKYYTGRGANHELLYTNNSSSPSTKFSNPNTKVRSSVLYNDVADDGTTIPLTLFGYNDSNYIDICGTINPETGTIAISGNNTFADQHGNNRTLELTICKDTVTGENICKPNSSDIFKQQNVCVFEITSYGKEVFQNCVQRPKMLKPSVSFCDNAFNDRSNSCINAKGPLGKDYQFKGNMTNCTNTQSESQIGMCTLQTSTPTNPFDFQAILTNRCYMNALAINQHDNTSKFLCYKNALPCQTQSTSAVNCNKCNLDEFCAEFSSTKSPSIFLSAKKVVGAERLCLYGYTNTYADMSEPWCKDGKEACNRVCAATYARTDNNQTISGAYIDVGSRTMPTPATVSPLTPPSCAYSRPITPQDQAKYRTRNPVEEGLCVDAYTIKFNKECTPQKKDPYFNKPLCSKIKTFCSKTDDQKQHYTHFDECQTMFKTCLGSDAPTKKQALSDGTITYTCNDIQTFATTSDTFKSANAPSKPLSPSNPNSEPVTPSKPNAKPLNSVSQ